MLAAGTAERHGHVAAGAVAQFGQPGIEKVHQLGQVALHVGLRFQVVAHARLAAAQRAQFRVPVRVGQHARVEHEVRLGRHAALVGEGFERQHQRRAVGLDQVADPGAQLAGRQVRGVDHVLLFAQWRQQFALQRDAVGQRGRGAAALQAIGQRMAAAGFGVALHQRGGVGVQEDHAQAGAHGAQGRDHIGQFRQFAGGPDVDGDGNALQAVIARIGDELGQEADRQVVDAGVARILEHAQGNGFA
ncbi:hypothetical protein G6F35_013588 [Rhizopus arrhizus]|nr:hypothetical protein G6F35_013588 [Rhizopus arrhizus]